MVEQAPLNRLHGFQGENGSPSDHDQENHEMSRFKRLLADITELAELQTHLAADDIRATFAATVRPLVLAVLAMVLLLGTLPVLLFGISSLLVEELEWLPYVAQLTCASTALVLAGGIGVLAVIKFKQCANPLQRSLHEFEKNLGTLRLMLGTQGQPTSDQQI